MSGSSALVAGLVVALIFSLLGFAFKKIGLRLGWTKEGAPACPIHQSDKDLVRDDDVAWWSSLSEKEVEGIYRQAALSNEKAIARLTESGENAWDAANVARRRICQFYCQLPDRPSHVDPGNDGDSKLPYALWGRVRDSLGTVLVPEGQIQDASSANAYVRRLIRSGQM